MVKKVGLDKKIYKQVCRKRTCKLCGAKLEFLINDIQGETTPNGAHYYIVCPECKGKIGV